MIEIEDLTIRYNGQETAIEDLSLTVEQGEFVLLTGPSGCGKSTLARCVIGLIPHSSEAEMSGRVMVDGVLTREQTVAELATRVGLVFQNPSTQLFGLNVAEEVAFGPRNLGLPPEDAAERCRFAMEATGIQHMSQRAIKTLSGGEQQRLAIAAVLAMRPKVLVLDEPTSDLDLKGTKAVLETLDRLRREHGLTILVIEHRLSEAGRFADRMLVMDQGRIVLDGSPESIFDEREFLSRLGIRYPQQSLRHDWPAERSERVVHPHGAQKPLVELQGIQAGYGQTMVLKDINFAVYPGEFVALIGENGAGKTTIAKLLAGLLRPRGGRVVWDGNAPLLSLGRRVGLLFQNPLHQLFCDSVEEEVGFGPRNFQMACGERLQAIMEAGGLNELGQRSPYSLSVGQQQRVALASILALEPALLVLDEPTMGQDWGSLSRVMDFLVELNGHGQAILLITHDHKLVCRYAQRILALEDGKISRRVPIVEQHAELSE
jgi:energy-coupling factor transporter ATP-binding protein EcfA2